MKIIFAQGNPEKRFDGTRHNLGFFLIDEIARALGIDWVEKSKFRALIAETTLLDEKIILVKPMTFYNDTGITARFLIDFYKIDSSDLLVIHDDLALPFGTIRVRSQGSDAGNNGIKSLNSHIGDNYKRLRVGIWNELRDQMDDVSFVLGRFSKSESDILPDIYKQTSSLVNDFVSGELQDQSTTVIEKTEK